MVRFFLYIEETISRRETHRTLTEVWHRTATSNAIHDIVQCDKEVREWSHQRTGGRAPIEEFMLSRSPGRIRLNHIYGDSERILLETASEHGMGQKVQHIIDHKLYVPETLFYSLLGWPERVRLNDPIVQNYEHRNDFPGIDQ